MIQKLATNISFSSLIRCAQSNHVLSQISTKINTNKRFDIRVLTYLIQPPGTYNALCGHVQEMNVYMKVSTMPLDFEDLAMSVYLYATDIPHFVEISHEVNQCSATKRDEPQ